MPPPDVVLVPRCECRHPAACRLQTVEQQPSWIYRDLGSGEFAGSEPACADVLTAVIRVAF